MLLPKRRARLRRVSGVAAASLGLTLLVGAPVANSAPDSPVDPQQEDGDEPALDFDAEWGGEPMYEEIEALATNGEGGFENYRIVALAVTNDGDVLASYDGRPTAADSPGPNSILQRRSTDNGETWGEQEVIAQGEEEDPIYGFSDPSYVVDRVTGDIFNFHVYSMDEGFGGSEPGTDLDDRDVIHANVARSDDNGETWESETITPDITPDEGWKSRFAASGQGIQLKYGEHAGRLIQQYTIINEDGDFQAVSVYSDDHGKTWQAGEPVGVGMDENKTVELSDGRVMLNSRDSGQSGYRKVAISEDGGETYGEVEVDDQLPDPANNGSIVRAFPNAEEGTPEAKVLLFSNAADKNQRRNGTVRMSCDDGETWPVSKAFEPEGVGYSTLATLPDGNIGLQYEPEGGNSGIQFSKFNLAWLEGVCADISAEDVSAPAGDTVDLDVTVTNQSGSDMENAELSIDTPDGWSVGDIDSVDLLADESVTVQVPITIADDAYAGEHSLGVSLATEQGTASSNVTVTVEADEGDVVTIAPALRDLQDSYDVGDALGYDYQVTNVSDETVSLIPSSDDLDGFNRPDAPNCGYQNLEAGDSYSCTSASHELTEDDFEEGEFSPSTSWEVRAGNYDGDVLDELEREGPSVDLTDDDGDDEDGAGEDGSGASGSDQNGDDGDGSSQEGSDAAGDDSDGSGSDESGNSGSGSDESASGTDATGEDADQNADGDEETPGSLPVTGTSLTALVVGALLLVAGGAMVIVRRRSAV